MPIVPGARLGRYEIRSRLGAGGMGEVYLADDASLNRRVAIKVLPPEHVADAHAIRRLTREAQAAAALDHPNICAVYEVGAAGGHHFIVMQYVEGETLAVRIARQPLAPRRDVGAGVAAGRGACAQYPASRHQAAERDDHAAGPPPCH
jgi:serine/threonine protein kinase